MSYSRRQLYAMGEPLGDSATYRKADGGLVLGGGGGGGGGGSSTTTNELPEWAKPYAKSTLEKADALTDIKQTPYQRYGAVNPTTGKFEAAPRIAGFSDMQINAQNAARDMQTSGATGAGIGVAGQAALRALGSDYQGGGYGNQFQAPDAYQTGQFRANNVRNQRLNQYQMEGPQDVQSRGYDAASMQEAQTGYNPNLQNYQMQGPADVRSQGYDAASMQTAQTGYRPDLQTFQMGPAERVGAQNFGGQSAQDYMSPYMQNVVDVQQREAQRNADIAGTQRGAQAARSGAFGGSRQAVMEAEAARNLATQKGDIQATGLQAAYQQAQQQFNADQARQLQAQQANQAAGLTVGQQNLASQQGTQQLGTQTGLQTALANLSSEQQANVQNQAAQNQARGMNAQQAMQAALANQQAGLSTEQQNLAANLGVQQLGTQTGLQTSLANLSNQQQAAVQNQAAQNQAMGMSSQQALQAALANQQAGLTTGQQNLAARLGVQQLGSGQNLQAQLANQQYGLQAQQLGEQSRQFGAGQGLQAASLGAQYGQAANQLNEQSRQYGAGLGMQGLQTALTGAGQLGALGGQQFQQGMDINKLQNAYGAQQQALRQQGLSQDYQDFLDEKNYPYKQLGFMSDMVRGLPLGNQATTQMYQSPGSMAGQIAGLGMGAYGMSQAFPGMFKAEGGLTQSYADGGSVESTGNIESIVSKLSDQQLQQAMEAAQARGDQAQMQIIQAEVAMRASERNGMAGAYNSLPQETQAGMEQSMAGGGIVAFADTGLVSDPMGNVSGSDSTGVPDDRTIFERLGIFNPENRRALEAGKRDAARKPEPNSPYAAKSATMLNADEAEAYAAQAGKKQKAEPKQLEGKGLGSVVGQAKAAAKAAGIPAEDFESQMRRMRKEFEGENADYKKEMLDQYKKAASRLEENKSRAGYEALANFGFNMAAQAAKPGQARRSGIMGALESAGATAPVFTQSMAESNKINRAAEDNLERMRMDQMRFDQSLARNDRQSALQYAAAISQDKKTQEMLDIERKKLGLLGQQAASASSTALQKIADDLQRNDPSIDRRSALNEASKIAGYSYRQDAANQGRLAENIRKIDEKFNMLDMLPPDSDMAKQMRANRDRQISEAKRQFGGEMQAGAGSNSVLKFDSKGNLIQ